MDQASRKPGTDAGNAANAEKVAAAGAGPMERAAEMLARGDLAATAAHLQAVAAEQRRLWSSGGDRQLLSGALATLAVTQELQRAQAAKEAGQQALASAAARTAMGTLSRAPMIPAAIRNSLSALGASFGAEAAAAADRETRAAGAAGSPASLPASGSAASAGRSGAQSGARTVVPKPSQPAQAPQARAGYDAALGKALARRAASGAPGTVGRCYEYVANAVDAVVGRFLTGGHAYMAASQFAARPGSFTEISASGLSGLPAGAIVVWGKGTSRSGHISIALGDGREASDHIAPQMLRHYGGAGARVFLPKTRTR